MNGFKYALSVGALLGMPIVVSAHGGGLNADGCHTNRKTGDYHCHRASAAKQTQQLAAQQALAAQPTKSTSTTATSSGATCYVGPRGGTYTITASGKKNYGGC